MSEQKKSVGCRVADGSTAFRDAFTFNPKYPQAFLEESVADCSSRLEEWSKSNVSSELAMSLPFPNRGLIGCRLSKELIEKRLLPSSESVHVTDDILERYPKLIIGRDQISILGAKSDSKGDARYPIADDYL
jgi:hypothetical protein